MAVTTYLRLQKPPFDTIPWDQAINGNMDILDSTIAQFLSVPGYTGTWVNATNYTSGQVVLDATTAMMWQCLVSHTSATAPTTFAQDRTAHPAYWLNTTTAPVAPVDQHNVGRNLLHNPLFNVAQRGTGPFTTATTTLDRWYNNVTTDTISITVYGVLDADRAAIGDEAVNNALQVAVTGSAATSAITCLQQSIEGVRRLSGKTVTISFWAMATAGTPKIGVNTRIYYGSGGSPSATINGLATGLSVTVSTTWTRYSLTTTLPTVAGKTIGTNGDDSTAVQLYFTSGATNNAVAGNIGVQTATFRLWGVQLEIGSVATPLEKPDPRYDLANCQRFYQRGSTQLYGYVSLAGGVISSLLGLPVTMRTIPTITANWTTTTNITAGNVVNSDVSSLLIYAQAIAAGGVIGVGTYTASADL